VKDAIEQERDGRHVAGQAFLDEGYSGATLLRPALQRTNGDDSSKPVDY
jgi:hypothetical protein